ncbi:hypothetical protein DES35_10472 [Schleiferia thermophila]|jgi:hypothetical protein|uniref:Uncharacterized protein n=1 Tax=Schleiferia thermophila TaxID=884107 RepID=A0A368ZZF6_9FLAO|nr:hypothetical protein DES35_10472 [Schleiferia thermophila]
MINFGLVDTADRLIRGIDMDEINLVRIRQKAG